MEYSKHIADEICDRMIEGESLLKICKDDHMPSRVSVYRWVDDHPDFRRRYNYAREGQAHFYADLIRDIAFDDAGDVFIDGDKIVNDHARVQRARLKVDTLKWVAARLLPRVYSDKAEATPAPGLAVTHIERRLLPARPSEPRPEPPRQLTYQPPAPGELTPDQWGVLRDLLDLIKRTVGDRDFDAVAGVLREALLKHFGALEDA
jgi:hypothetical protein